MQNKERRFSNQGDSTYAMYIKCVKMISHRSGMTSFVVMALCMHSLHLENEYGLGHLGELPLLWLRNLRNNCPHAFAIHESKDVIGNGILFFYLWKTPCINYTWNALSVEQCLFNKASQTLWPCHEIRCCTSI